MNKILIVWALCWVCLGLVVKCTQDDITRQKNAIKEKKANTNRW